MSERGGSPTGRDRPRYERILGLKIRVTVFWALLFLSVTLVPSLLSHLPLFLGYGVVTAVGGGMVGILLSLLVSFLVAHLLAR